MNTGSFIVYIKTETLTLTLQKMLKQDWILQIKNQTDHYLKKKLRNYWINEKRNRRENNAREKLGKSEKTQRYQAGSNQTKKNLFSVTTKLPYNKMFFRKFVSHRNEKNTDTHE